MDSHLVDAWHKDGVVLLPEFFTPDEIKPIYQDYQSIYGEAGQGDGSAVDFKVDGAIGAGHAKQFMNIDVLPYAGSTAMNMISLHPKLIEISKQLLGVDEVHLYQSHTWAKYTGEADYDQAHHCDFGNHTLTVPSDDASMRTVNFIIYISDVIDDLGALHYVSKDDSDEILGEGAVIAPSETQMELKERERSAAAPAGSLLIYGIDAFHRGTNLTRTDGFRYTMTVSYKAANNPMIDFHVWQFSAERPWAKIFNEATPDQLACLGIPRPGDSFWTPRTLELTNKRWPEWDMSDYAL